MKNCPRGKVRWKGKGEEPWRPLPPPASQQALERKAFSQEPARGGLCVPGCPGPATRFVPAFPASALSSGEFLQTNIIMCVLQCLKHSRLPKINKTIFTGSP